MIRKGIICVHREKDGGEYDKGRKQFKDKGEGIYLTKTREHKHKLEIVSITGMGMPF